MGGTFDPDAFLRETAPASSAAGDFDPDAFLKQTAGPSAQTNEEPTLDAPSTGAFHYARQISGGLGDKIIAAEQAIWDKHRDKTGTVTFGDAYRRNLGFNDKLLEASDEAHPVARWIGNGAGFAGNLAALGLGELGALPFVRSGAGAAGTTTLAQLAGQGAKVGGVLGTLGGFGADRSNSTLGTLANTTLGGLVGGGLGAVMPYVSNVAGRGLQYAGGKLGDLAGWLKVHSLHPTPTVAEKMAELPGGEVGVGRTLLDQGLGGFTKKGTAAQVKDALQEAGKGITSLAADHDAAGGAPLALDGALAAGRKAATALLDEPTTEEAGNRLSNLVDKYDQKYGGRPVSASEALKLKRALGDAAYGAGKQFEKSGDTIAGDFGAGLSKFERAVDDALDQHLGPDFEQANLTYRQLMGASRAATRAAGRTQGNAHLIGGLVPTLAGVGASAAGHGGPEAIAAGLGASLLQKYGSQAGARFLYGPAAGSMNLAGLALRGGLPSAMASGAASETGAAYGPNLLDLLRRPELLDPTQRIR